MKTTTLREQIEEWLASQAMNYGEKKAYEDGALRMAKWWAEKLGRLSHLTETDGTKERAILEELEAATREILEGGE